MLKVVRWKRHRSQTPPPLDRHQLALQLADLTKYVFSLWQLWGYGPDEMLEACEEKGALVERRFLSECAQPAPGQPVLLADVDNTLLDFHSTLAFWLTQQRPELLPATRSGPQQTPFRTLQTDLDLNLPWHTYRELKDHFEASGGYGPRYAILYPDTLSFLAAAQQRGYFIAIFTARPQDQYARIWLDTWDSLTVGTPTPDQLRFGDGERLLYARQLQDAGHHVLYLEDHPDLARRAARMGIRTVVRRHPYNVELEQELEGFPTLGLTEQLHPDLLTLPVQEQPTLEETPA